MKIRFAVSAPVDVEVAILSAQSNVVRHLAAGLLGDHAPEPFQKGALAQEIVWDGRDDAGKQVSGVRFQEGNPSPLTPDTRHLTPPLIVRLRLALQPRLDAILGRSDNALHGVSALTVSPKGDLFVLLTDHFRGRAEMRVLDRSGKYLRTIMPYAANTALERTEAVGHVMIDGKRQPLVFNGQGHSLYPLVAGMRNQTMAWHPEGYLIAASSLGSMCNHGPPRFLIAFHPDGGAPEKAGYVGPQIRIAHGFMGGAGEAYAPGMDRLAISPDGQWIYLMQSMKGTTFEKQEAQHCVFRVKWTDKELGTPWLGKKEPGAGDDEFSDPQGIATDKDGRIYVCDCGNGRVKVYAPDGQLLGKLAVPEPAQIAVHPATGAIYLLCRKVQRSYDLKKSGGLASRVLKFGPWKDGPPQEIARLEFDAAQRIAELMALDGSAATPQLWVAFYTGWGKPAELAQIADEGAELRAGPPLPQGEGLHFPSFLAADPERGRVIVYEHLSGGNKGLRAIDIDTGKLTTLGINGSDIAVDPRGNLYVMDMYDANSMSRYGPDFQPLPFPATGSKKIKFQYRAYGPSMGLRGHCIAPNGDLYVRRSPNHACVATVDVWGLDGTLKKAALINGAGSGDSGIGVDNRGNVYLGMNIKPADELLPADFAKAVPSTAWSYYRQNGRQPPWSWLYANPYLFHMGAIFKFGPEGGRIYGNYGAKASSIDASLALSNAPANAVACKSSYTRWDVKIVGANWRYPGIGIIPQSFDAFHGDDGCECMQSQLDADPYGRVYAPSAFYSSVEMVDSAGNRLARIGAYGNADSAGPTSPVPDPEIAFAWPTDCDYAEYDGRLYVTDSVNRRVTVVRFDATASAACAIP